MKKIVIVVLATLLVACATPVGQKFDTSYVDKIEKGRTTKAEVLKNLGEPRRKSRTSQGETWSYMHSDGTSVLGLYGAIFSGNGDRAAKADNLSITFTGDVVQDFQFSQ